MTNISKTKRSYAKFAGMGDHEKFLSRISKTLYYKKFPQKDGLSLPITELAAEIFTDVKNGKSLDRLDVEEASRISRHACVSPCSFVLALLYLERLKDCNPEYLQKVAPSELFLVTLMVASKFLMDDGESDEVYNSEWAQSGHISTGRINRLEMEFLKAINWTVYVHNQDFWRKLRNLERDIAYKEAKKRGWFSYTDLNVLLSTDQLEALVSTVVNVSSVFIATYAAGLLALVASVLLTNRLAINALTAITTSHHHKPATPPCSGNLTHRFDLTTNHSCQTENLLTEDEDANNCLELMQDLRGKQVDSVTFSHRFVAKKRQSHFRIHDNSFQLKDFFDSMNKFSLPNWIDYLPKLSINHRR